MGKRHNLEEIVAKLRQVDVLTTQGATVADAIRQIGVTQSTHYRWRKEFGGLQTNQVKRMKGLEQESARLRKTVSDLTLDKMILIFSSAENFRRVARRISRTVLSASRFIIVALQWHTMSPQISLRQLG